MGHREFRVSGSAEVSAGTVAHCSSEATGSALHLWPLARALERFMSEHSAMPFFATAFAMTFFYF